MCSSLLILHLNRKVLHQQSAVYYHIISQANSISLNKDALKTFRAKTHYFFINQYMKLIFTRWLIMNVKRYDHVFWAREHHVCRDIWTNFPLKKAPEKSLINVKSLKEYSKSKFTQKGTQKSITKCTQKVPAYSAVPKSGRMVSMV